MTATGAREAVLVTSRAETDILGKKTERENIVTIAWHMPVSYDPLMFAIALSNKRFSHKLISKSKVFAINFMPASFKKQILFCGKNSGELVDKFGKTGLTKEESEKIDCPRINEAIAFLECEVVEEFNAGDHVVFVGKVLNSGQKKKAKRLYHLGGDKFISTKENM